MIGRPHHAPSASFCNCELRDDPGVRFAGRMRIVARNRLNRGRRVNWRSDLAVEAGLRAEPL
jgi:hypothetical protein